MKGATRIQPVRRCHAARAAALFAALALPAAVGHAQPATQPLTIIRLAGEEDVLWLVSTEPQRSAVFSRGASEPFRPRPPLNGELVALAAGGGSLFGFVADGAFYELVDEDWVRRRDLPRRRLPIDVASAADGVYALITSPAAGEIPKLAGTQRPTTTSPYDAGDAPLTVVRYEATGWAAITPCPASLRREGNLPLRIGVLQDSLLVLRSAAGSDRIECLRYSLDTREWSAGPNSLALPGLRAFWFLHVNRDPTLVAAVRDDHNTELKAFRLPGQQEAASLEWRSTELKLADPKVSVGPVEYSHAAGFNQHLAVLVQRASGSPVIQFARWDAPPAEPAVAVAGVLAQESAQRRGSWLQVLTLLLLFLVLLALFLFRRGAMVTSIPLPPEFSLALSFQRLVAWLLDLTPFVLVTAAVLGVDWQAGLRELFGWALGSDAASGKFPHYATLLWWFVASGLHSVYTLLMELLTGRTLGKVLAGTRILSERGTPPTMLQIVARNALRTVELLPPLWLLGFLVVLSRNRQRLGDIFARTLVVRSVRPPDKEDS